jgi:hypothetical protein
MAIILSFTSLRHRILLAVTFRTTPWYQQIWLGISVMTVYEIQLDSLVVVGRTAMSASSSVRPLSRWLANQVNTGQSRRAPMNQVPERFESPESRPW